MQSEREMKVVFLMLFGLACAPAADEKDIARLPDGPGKEVVGKICVSCHDSGNFRRRASPARSGPIRWTTWYSAGPAARPPKSKPWSPT